MSAMDWNSNIENDGREFIILPTGNYPFTVVKFEKGYFEGSAKIDPCPRADLTLAVETKNGNVNIHTNLLLDRTFEWKIGGFFRSIGLKEKGKKIKMDWSKVQGAKGIAHITRDTWVDRNGNERESNNVAYYVTSNNSDEFNNADDTF